MIQSKKLNKIRFKYFFYFRQIHNDERRLIKLLKTDGPTKFDLEKFYHLVYEVVTEMRNKNCDWSSIQYAGIVYNVMFRKILTIKRTEHFVCLIFQFL